MRRKPCAESSLALNCGRQKLSVVARLVCGIHLAQKPGETNVRLSSLPPKHVSKRHAHEEAQRAVAMKDLKRILLAALVLCTISAGTLADDQRDKHDPPPKQEKVIEKRDKEPPKRDNPPRSNDQQKNNDRKKPDF